MGVSEIRGTLLGVLIGLEYYYLWSTLGPISVNPHVKIFLQGGLAAQVATAFVCLLSAKIEGNHDADCSPCCMSAAAAP